MKRRKSRALQAALSYARRGWPVFPLNGKIPLTAHGFHDATTDEAQLRAWWKSWPDAGIGVPTGAPSGVVALDVDPRHGGWESLARLQEERPLPETLSQTTGGGGRHDLFGLPEGLEVRCVNSLMPGLDFKASGGYVVLPPSLHPESGKRYKWTSDREVAPLPQWLAEMAASRNGVGDGLAEAPEDILRILAVLQKVKKTGQGWKARCPAHDDNEPSLSIHHHGRVLFKCFGGCSQGAVLEALEKLGVWPPGGESRAGGPVIRLAAGELDRVVREAVEALRGAGVPIYLRGDILVHPVLTEEDVRRGGIFRPAGSAVLRPVSAEWLALELTRAARFEKFDKRQKKWHPADPPARVLQTVIAVPEEGGWPELRAVVRHPVLTPDGRYLAGARVYDAQLKLLLLGAQDGAEPAPKPTRKDAKAAAARLSLHLRHFPFTSDVDRSVALAYLISCLMRPVLPTCPLFGFDSPVAGTGKSLLVDVGALLATGATAPVLEYGATGEEFAKRLDASQIEGDAIVSVDNVDRPVEGAALCSTLSQLYRRIRWLGQSKLITVPCTSLVSATGNNLTLAGDATRRGVVCRMDARMERPETRSFDQDLLAETRERRQELICDCLTIVRGYIHARKPKGGLTPFGGFEEWSRIVRGGLVWVGQEDPLKSVERIRENDPQRGEILTVFSAWRTAFGDGYATCAEAAEKAVSEKDFADALATAARTGKSGDIITKSLGKWLQKHRGSIVSGMTLTSKNKGRGLLAWKVGLVCSVALSPTTNARSVRTKKGRGQSTKQQSSLNPPRGPGKNVKQQGFLERGLLQTLQTAESAKASPPNMTARDRLTLTDVTRAAAELKEAQARPRRRSKKKTAASKKIVLKKANRQKFGGS